jgi:hypothetical protein
MFDHNVTQSGFDVVPLAICEGCDRYVKDCADGVLEIRLREINPITGTAVSKGIGFVFVNGMRWAAACCGYRARGMTVVGRIHWWHARNAQFCVVERSASW